MKNAILLIKKSYPFNIIRTYLVRKILQESHFKKTQENYKGLV
ncbi:hypothetical protein T08_10950 [Trichinella sp. T8]|nr:hypothetical protein T08_10950 [Trichinella sp. T8]